MVKKKGDSVNSDEPVVELETDKATLEVYAQSNGVLSEIYIDAGQDVEIGAELAEFLENENIDLNEVIEDVKLKSNDKNETTAIKTLFKEDATSLNISSLIFPLLKRFFTSIYSELL